MTYKEKSCSADEFVKVDEIPFDFVRRRMSVILRNKKTENFILVSKGALEEMLDICVSYQREKAGELVPLTKKLKQEAIELSNALNEEGLRVVAVGYKSVQDNKISFNIKNESNMILTGLIAFLDPPKESTRPAVQKLIELGITIKVLTGDTPVVCRRVCEEIGLPVTGIVTTSDLIGLDDEEMSKLANRTTIFAKLTPLQKAQVVKALKRNENIVGFLGDGINDAPALKESDVGISVDDSVEVAKESADIILLEKSLLVLVDGVLEGRRTYGNTIKYIKLAISSNFGNVFSVLIASAWLPFLPMLTIHLVLQNMLYDFSQIVIPWDNLDSDYLRSPKKWSSRSIITFMVCMGPISSIFDVATFAFCWWKYNCGVNPDACATEFQTSWFLEGLFTQTMIVHMLRTDKVPFFQSTSAWSLIVSSLVAMAAAITITSTSLAKVFQMVTPRASFYPYLVGAVLSYCLLSQLAKPSNSPVMGGIAK